MENNFCVLQNGALIWFTTDPVWSIKLHVLVSSNHLESTRTYLMWFRSGTIEKAPLWCAWYWRNIFLVCRKSTVLPFCMLKIDVAPFFGMLSMRIDRLNAVVIHERGGGGTFRHNLLLTVGQLQRLFCSAQTWDETSVNSKWFVGWFLQVLKEAEDI